MIATLWKPQPEAAIKKNSTAWKIAAIAILGLQKIPVPPPLFKQSVRMAMRLLTLKTKDID